MSPGFSYGGGELALFATAANWKRYLLHLILPFLSGDVLEVGGGIGANAEIFLPACAGRVSSWVLLEPDPRHCRLASERGLQIPGGGPLHVRQGTTESLPPLPRFHTILYLDVLEHIEDHRAELQRARRLLLPGGHLVVMSPAHAFLFSRFDEAIGHHRRYDRETLRALAPPTTREEFSGYIDSAGLLASLANRFLLRQAMPGAAQIRFWDKVLVPVSRVLDSLFGFALGKSILVVWRAI